MHDATQEGCETCEACGNEMNYICACCADSVCMNCGMFCCHQCGVVLCDECTVDLPRDGEAKCGMCRYYHSD